jgi:hypothetical protein
MAVRLLRKRKDDGLAVLYAGGSEPDQPGATSAYFRLLEQKCYQWRDPNAPRTGAPK